jgi:hypothetical protein
MHHAWVTRRDDPGAAFELAWEEGAASYFGVPIKRDYVRAVVHAGNRHWRYGVLDAFWIGSPLLTGEEPVENVIEAIGGAGIGA